MSYPTCAFLICFFLTLCTTTEGAACRNKPLLFNFGDSNSDTGNAYVIKGLQLEFPEGRTFFHEPTSRVCDGRLIVDFLCESLETNFLTPYFELFAPNFSNGVNFAVAQADTLRVSDPITPYMLSTQISEFSFFRNASIRQRFIDENQLKSALFMFDIGQNDIQGNYITLEQILTRIPRVLSNIKNAMQRIYELGGRNFWVHNTGPLGCLPQNVRNTSTVVLDQYGCVSGRNEAAADFNSKLLNLTGELRLEMPDAKIIYVDIFSIKLDLIVNATSYEFEDPFKPCKEMSLCPEGSRYVSWDGVHYTEAANMLVASKILSNNYSTPSHLPFNFFCN